MFPFSHFQTILAGFPTEEMSLAAALIVLLLFNMISGCGLKPKFKMAGVC